MKTKFGPSGILCVMLVVLALALVPGMSQAGPGDNGDRLQTRDQLRDQAQDCTLDVPDLDRLQIRDQDRLRDGSCQTLLSLTPPNEGQDGNTIRHRIQERAQHNWYLIPGLMLAPIWPGTF